MSHSVSEAAARAVKNSQKVAADTRTPEQRLSTIRQNRRAKLFITPDDQDFLLAQNDAQAVVIADLNSQITAMVAAQEEIARLRAILNEFEKANISGTFFSDPDDITKADSIEFLKRTSPSNPRKSTYAHIADQEGAV